MEHKPLFSLRQGYLGLSEAGNLVAIFATALAGVVAHWMYDVLVMGLQATPQAFEFGTVMVVLTQLGRVRSTYGKVSRRSCPGPGEWIRPHR